MKVSGRYVSHTAEIKLGPLLSRYVLTDTSLLDVNL